jgi:hypothetical protein
MRASRASGDWLGESLGRNFDGLIAGKPPAPYAIACLHGTSISFIRIDFEHAATARFLAQFFYRASPYRLSVLVEPKVHWFLHGENSFQVIEMKPAPDNPAGR